MSLPHATSGQVVDIGPLDDRLKETVSTALLRTEKLELMRLVLPTGKSLPEHHVDGECTIQCIEGVVSLDVEGVVQSMRMGQIVYLAPGVRHALVAVKDASVLVTILRNQK